MKRIIFGLVLFAAFSTLSFGKVIVRGNSNTPLGTYTIELNDKPVMLAGEEMKCYLISYENSPMQVKVLVDKEKNCKNYLVITDDFLCIPERKFFGNRLDAKYNASGTHYLRMIT